LKNASQVSVLLVAATQASLSVPDQFP